MTVIKVYERKEGANFVCFLTSPPPHHLSIPSFNQPFPINLLVEFFRLILTLRKIFDLFDGIFVLSTLKRAEIFPNAASTDYFVWPAVRLYMCLYVHMYVSTYVRFDSYLAEHLSLFRALVLFMQTHLSST